MTKYASTPDAQLLPRRLTRKRRVQDQAGKATTRKRADMDGEKVPRKGHVSKSLRATEPMNQSFTHKLDGSIEERWPTPASMTVLDTSNPAAEHPRNNDEEEVPHSNTVGVPRAPPIETSQTHAAISTDDNDDFGQLWFDFEPDNHSTDDFAYSSYNPALPQNAEVHVDENDFDDDDLMDDDLLDLPTDTVDDSSSLNPSGSPIKVNVFGESFQGTHTPGTCVDNTLVLDEEMYGSDPMPKKFTSPVTSTTRSLAATGDEAHKPIVRPAFPTAVRDRSPIIGLTSNTLLRTCFRVGEAIHQSCQAVKIGNNILIEVYARVLNSERDGLQQRFTLCDLFHAKPPYIQAVYAAAIWKSVQLFEYDSARLLQQGRICRCIGTMKRDGRDWVMTVLNVWEATWDDVQWVEGIVSS